MFPSNPFSKRYGLSTPPEIRVTHDAPEQVCVAVLDEAVRLRVDEEALREIVCRTLRREPDQSNWSPSNVIGEVRKLLRDCEWYRVYDVAEAIAAALPSGRKERYEHAINEAFVDEGIGWRFQDHVLVVRSEAAFETARRNASQLLSESGRTTAQRNVDSALIDLSKRPEPNCSDAVFHACSALEALARDLTADSSATFGQITQRYPQLFPAPLNSAFDKIWGFASDRARHATQGREPTFSEAELVVGLCSQAIVYLERQSRSHGAASTRSPYGGT
jgi:hypothetical protein